MARTVLPNPQVQLKLKAKEQLESDTETQVVEEASHEESESEENGVSESTAAADCHSDAAEECNHGGDVCPPTCIWEECRTFLRRLRCLTSEGDPLPFKNCIQRHFSVDKDYIVTGLHDGAVDDTETMIQINGTTLLSLDPTVLGRVLGIPFEGLPIAEKAPRGRQLLELPPNTLVQKDGALIDSLQHDLQCYIVEQKEVLFLPARESLIPVGQLIALAQSFFHNTEFNWAEHRVKYVAMRVRDKNMAALPKTAKNLLSRYIRSALPFLPWIEPATTQNEECEDVEGEEECCVESEEASPPETRYKKRPNKSMTTRVRRERLQCRSYATRAKTKSLSPVSREVPPEDNEVRRMRKRKGASDPGSEDGRTPKLRKLAMDHLADLQAEQDAEVIALHRYNRMLRKCLAAREKEIAILESLVPAMFYFHRKSAVTIDKMTSQYTHAPNR